MSLATVRPQQASLARERAAARKYNRASGCKTLENPNAGSEGFVRLWVLVYRVHVACGSLEGSLETQSFLWHAQPTNRRHAHRRYRDGLGH